MPWSCLSKGNIRKWKDPKGGIIHGLSHHKWGSLHYRIQKKGIIAKLKKTGGDQINRSAILHPKLRYVENIRRYFDTLTWMDDQQQVLAKEQDISTEISRDAIPDNEQVITAQ